LLIKHAWYRHPTLLWFLKSSTINFILPFFNGVMLGLGEIVANELVFSYGWFGAWRHSTPLGLSTKVSPTATAEYKKTM
ncbi:outer membrane protein TOM13-domain-containing protein, partial [Spinellus fusiger]